jgi:drug/metabolite transporter (DMT)-like permease
VSTTATKAAVRAKPTRWQADLALAIVALMWGSTFVVVKRALTEISTMYFLAVRFTLASLCMLLIFTSAFRRAGWRAVWRGLLGGATAGVFLWLGYVLQSFGLKYTTAGNSGFLTGLYIVLVPLISAYVYRKWPQIPELVGIAIAGIGIVLLTFPSFDRKFNMNPGDLLTLGCAIAFAFHLLILGYYSQRERFEAVALGQIVCAAVLSAASLGVEPPQAVWSSGVVFAIVLTSLFATALAFALQTWAQRFTSATRTALIFALEPVFAFTTAVLLGGERLTLAAVCGGSLILAGIITVEMKPGRSL